MTASGAVSPAPGRPWYQSTWLRHAGAAVGLLLLVAAVMVVWRQRQVLDDAQAALSSPSPLWLGLLLAAVLVNVVLTGLMFSLLMSRYGRVGRLEMQALIASTALLNYLPLRAGMVGRIAYHKVVNRISVADSARTILQGLGLSAVITGYLAAALALCAATEVPLWWGVLLPVPVLAAGGCWRSARVWLWAALMRYADVLVWSLRYQAAFHLLGLSLESEVALALACVSVMTTLVPFLSNGLGLREWAIGLAAPLMTNVNLELGLTAELVNRAAELLVVLGAGLAGITYVTLRMRRRRGPAAP